MYIVHYVKIIMYFEDCLPISYTKVNITILSVVFIITAKSALSWHDRPIRPQVCILRSLIIYLLAMMFDMHCVSPSQTL